MAEERRDDKAPRQEEHNPGDGRPRGNRNRRFRGSKRNGTQRESPAKDGAPKESVPKEGVPKDGVPKDIATRDSLPKGGALREGTPREGLPRDGSQRDSISRDVMSRDNGNQTQGRPSAGRNAAGSRVADVAAVVPAQEARKDSPICPLCQKAIYDMSNAVAEPAFGLPAHFDCILDRVTAAETIAPNEKIVYLGAGAFGVVEFRDKNEASFVVKRRIQWEKEGEKKDWRKTLSSGIINL